MAVGLLRSGDWPAARHAIFLLTRWLGPKLLVGVAKGTVTYSDLTLHMNITMQLCTSCLDFNEIK